MSKLLTGLVAVSMVATLVPVAGAQSTADLQTQINALLAQISALQAQLAGTTTATTYTKDLTLGSTGSEVTALQTFLVSKSFLTMPAGVSMGYFGSLTKSALAAYQASVGISPASGYFGPITRAKLNSSVVVVTPPVVTPTSTPPVVNAEGSFTVAIAAAPAAGTISAGTNVPVYGIDVRATGSNMKIDRLDLQLAVTSVGATVIHNPSSFILKINVLDGSTVLTSKAISASDIYQDANQAYWTRLTGLNFNVPKDTTKTLTVTFDTVSAVDNNRTVTINVYGANGLRGVDTLGLNTYAALGTTRAQIFRAGGASVLTVSVNTNTPLENNAVVDGTNGLNDQVMLIFDAKATVDNSTITRLAFRQSYSASGTASTIKVYDGSTLVGSGAASGTGAIDGVTTLTNLAISVPKDTTKTLTVKMDFPAGYGLGEVASVSMNTTESVAYNRADGTTASATIAAVVQGNGVHLYRRAPIVTLVSTSIARSAIAGLAGNVASTQLDATIVVKLKAVGGTLIAPTSTADALSFRAAAMASDSFINSIYATFATSGLATVATTTEADASSTYAITLSPVKATYAENEEVTITIQGSSKSATTYLSSRYFNFVLSRLSWRMTGQAVVNQTWGLASYITNWALMP